MEALEIQWAATHSAARYGEYLRQSGVSGCQVLEKQALGDVLALRLDTRPQDLSALLFELRGVQRDPAQTRIVGYEPEKNLLTVEAAPALQAIWAGAQPDEIRIVCDLKQPVRRISDWYQRYGAKLQAPQTRRAAPDTTPHPLGVKPTPEQQAAIDLALSAPLAWVSGGPGAGKTGCVLASCLLHYLTQNQRVLLTAPTEAALERILAEILPILLAAGIQRESMLRLGPAAPEFTSAYPQVGEENGWQRQLELLTMQVTEQEAVTKRSRERLAFARRLQVLEEEVLPGLGQVVAANGELKARMLTYEEAERALLRVQRQLAATQGKINDIQNQLNKLDRTERSPLHRVKAAMQPRLQEELDSQRAALRQEQSELHMRQRHLRTDMVSQAEQTRAALAAASDRSQLEAWLEKVRESCRREQGFEKVAEALSENNAAEVLATMEKKAASGREYLRQQQELAQARQEPSPAEQEARLSQLTERLKQWQSRATGRRCQEALLVACSLDTYLQRCAPLADKAEQRLVLAPQHIFLDEADAAPLVKALPLTAVGCPLTLLGDDRQLPPSCRLEDARMSRPENQTMFLWAQSALYIGSVWADTLPELREQYLRGLSPDSSLLPKAEITGSWRYGGELARILDTYVYQNGFHSLRERSAFTLLAIDAPDSGDSGHENLAEARAALAYLRQDSSGSCVILTPYGEQAALLQRLNPELARQGRAMTIAASQGRCWDTVILSACDHGHNWAADSHNKQARGQQMLTTALSRARRRLVLVADIAYWRLQNNQLLTALLAAADKQ